MCGRSYVRHHMVPAETLRPALAQTIERRHPELWTGHGRLCQPCLHAERTAHVIDELERERGELSAVDREISEKASEHLVIASRFEDQFRKRLTFGQRTADAVARVGGSWPFVIGFGLFLSAWIALNSVLSRPHAFDPFPYILLNLVLSCLAAVQAPVIMMSQNRSAARDRAEADQDYRVNLKAEIEIATLHEKIDHLLHVQWQRMVELQQTQLDMLEELTRRRR